MNTAFKNTISALMVLSVLFFAPAPSLCEDIMSFSSGVEEGEIVRLGQGLTYSIAILQDIELEGAWSTIIINLSEGMSLGEISFTPARDEEEYPVDKEIIPGNDGCVILCSVLYEGDTVKFSAVMDDEFDEAIVSVSVNESNAQISNPVYLPPKPVQTQAPQEVEEEEPAAPAPDPQHSDINTLPIIMSIVLGVFGAALGVLYAERKEAWVRRLLFGFMQWLELVKEKLKYMKER